MVETLLCHQKGISYSAYVGIRSDGETMTDEEYAPVSRRLRATELP